MMKPRLLYLLPLLLLQCKKKEEAAAPEYRIDVSRYTMVDENGVVMGDVDPTDWTYDPNWDAATLAIFAPPPAALLAGTDTATIRLFPVLPNPGNGDFLFAYSASRSTLLQLVVTDDRLQVQLRSFVPLANANTIYNTRIGLPATVGTGNYRLHYAFYNAAGTIYYKGHGDIRVQR